MDQLVFTAWIAGIIEGEGAIMLTNGKYKRPTITVAMTDRDVVKRFADLTGGTFNEVKRNYEPQHKQVWYSSLNGAKAEEWICEVYPFLGERRQAKAKQVLLDFASRGDFTPGAAALAKTQCPSGHPYTEANTVWRDKEHTKRACRECRNSRTRRYRARLRDKLI